MNKQYNITLLGTNCVPHSINYRFTTFSLSIIIDHPLSSGFIRLILCSPKRVAKIGQFIEIKNKTPGN